MEISPALARSVPQALAEHFAAPRRLTVKQRKRWAEILLSWEMKNEYDVFDEGGRPVLNVKEEGEGFVALMARVFLGPLRPFSAVVREIGSHKAVLSLRRPFRFFFHRLEVSAADGAPLGAIERRWAWIRRIYRIEDAQGREVARLFGPVLKPWTFEIQIGGRAVGAIRKRWSGLGKELFTDADNFGVELDKIEEPWLKALAFAATVLIDVVHFERVKR